MAGKDTTPKLLDSDKHHLSVNEHFLSSSPGIVIVD